MFVLNPIAYPAVSSISAVISPVGGLRTRLDNRSAISESLSGVWITHKSYLYNSNNIPCCLAGALPSGL